MPHITTAMRWSVRRGVGDIVLDSVLGRRDLSSVSQSFSSWSSCMQATYCKWPVIAAIIIGGLIVFSILWCIIRCACCGYSCCCSCFSFLSCCDCCGGCCDGKKDKPMKHLDDDPFNHRAGPPNQGYQAPAPMMGGALPVAPEPPKFAQFEVGKNGLYVDPKPALSEDALPPMPSWDSATKKRVAEEEEKNGVELGNLDPTTGQSVPLMTGAVGPATTMPPSPGPDLRAVSPYGARPGQGIGGNGYMGVAGDYSPQPPQNGFNAVGNAPYRGPGSPGPGRGGPPRGYEPNPPQNRNGPGGRGYGPPQDMNNLRGFTASPQQMDPPQMNRQGGGGRGGYGPPSPQTSGQSPYGSNEFVGVAAGGEDYGRPQPQRQFSSNSPRPYAQPSRQYSEDSARALNPGRQQYQDQPYNNVQPNNPPPRGPSRGPSRGPDPQNRMASPGPISNAGFDFGIDAQQPRTRPNPPPQQNYNQRPGPPMRQGSRDNYGNAGGRPKNPPPRQNTRDDFGNSARSPPPQEPAYPGYKPYQPPNNQGPRGGGPPPSLTPGGGRGREPQGWDPVY